MATRICKDANFFLKQRKKKSTFALAKQNYKSECRTALFYPKKERRLLWLKPLVSAR